MSTVSVLPTAWATLEAALRARRPVWVSYHGRSRLICAHALGWKAGRAMVLGYQAGGETSSGALDPDPRKRWRLLFVDEVDEVVDADAAACWATADNYNAAHPFPAIDEVFTAVDLEPPPRRR
ncbi:MAG: hypothetical protein ACRD12_12515 [Acidimicrobiales bacterium]